MLMRGRVAAGIAAVAAATVVALGGAAPAFAAVDGRIDSAAADNDTGTLNIAFSVLGLAPGQTVDPATVKVTVNGTEVPSEAKIFDPNAGVARLSVLTIDISSSMRDFGKMDAAKTAANVYLDSLPADVKVGLVTFGQEVTVVAQPTTDRAALRADVASLEAGGATRLYDGVVAGVNLLGTTGLRSQLVISDGKDKTSVDYTREQAAEIVKNSGTTLDAVALGTDEQKADLDVLTAAGRGTTISVTGADLATELSTAFASSAQASQQQLAIAAAIPAQFVNSSQTVTVTADTSAGAASGDIYTIMPAKAAAVTDPTVEFGPKPVNTNVGIFGERWFLWLCLLAIASALFVLLAVALLATDTDSRTEGRMRRRLSRYSLTPRQESKATQSTALGDSQVARSAVEFAGRVVQGRDLDNALGTKLEAAGVPLRPAEWLIIHFGSTFGAALIFALVSLAIGGDISWLATLLGLLLGAVGPWVYLSIKEDRRKSRFAQQLPETLQLLAGSLAAGYSLPQAVDTVVQESDGPMAIELNRAIVEARLGVPMEDALETVALRMNSVDFAWVVMAIRIQREVGGNLSEVLSNVAATMRERERLRRQVEVLSAEGRLSAVILGMLPILFVVYLVLARPDYLSVMLTTPLGLVMIVVGILLLIAGIFWLRKTVKVEV